MKFDIHIPEDVNWIAMDCDGNWWGFECEPVFNNGEWDTKEGNAHLLFSGDMWGPDIEGSLFEVEWV